MNVKALFPMLIWLIISSYATAQELDRDKVIADSIAILKLYEESTQFFGQGQYEMAAMKLEEAKAKSTSLYGRASDKVGNLAQALGVNYYYLGRVEEAGEAWREARDIISNVFGEKSVQAANINKYVGVYYSAIGNYSGALAVSKENLEIYLKQHGEKHLTVADTYNEIGTAQLALGDYFEALATLKKATALQKKIAGEENMNYSTYLGNVGVAYNNIGQYRLAIQELNKALRIRKRFLPEGHPDLARFYNNIGNGFNGLEDFDKAIPAFEKAIAIRIKSLGDNHPKLVDIYNNIAIAYAKNKKYQEAKYYFDLCIDVLTKSNGANGFKTINAYISIGALYNKIGEYDQAIQYLDKSLSLAKEAFGDTSLLVAYTYGNLGDSWGGKGNSTKSVEFRKKNLSVLTHLFGGYGNDVAVSYYNLAQQYLSTKEFIKGKALLKKGCESLKYTVADDLDKVESIPDLILLLRSLGRVSLEQHRESKVLELLVESHEYYLQTLKAIDVQIGRVGNTTKSFTVEEAKRAYEEAIYVSLSLFEETDDASYKKLCFNYSEKSKSLLLREALVESNALAFGGVPDSLLQKEHSLRVSIATNERIRKNMIAQVNEAVDSMVLEISSLLYDLKKEHTSLKSQFANDYRKYHDAKYQLETINLEELQKQILGPGHSLVEFFIGDNVIYIYLVDSDSIDVIDLQLDFPLFEWVENMTKEGIYGYYTNPNKFREEEALINYTKSAIKIYEKLLKPLEGRLKENVIIVPDEVLGYIPFEALLTKKPGRVGAFSTYPFLLYEHELSYSYSATLLEEMERKIHIEVPSRTLLGMAPFFGGDLDSIRAEIRAEATEFPIERDSLGPLPYSGKEVAAISSLFEGEFLYGPEASRGEFGALARRFKILHLSTHGKADDRFGDYAYLAFANGSKDNGFEKLFARDLYNFTLNADLVVLSACETGTGSLRKGEGIISLARAFAYAGAKSIFPTLWKVRDSQTQELVVSFYRNLNNGMAKSEALHRAKLDFVNKHKVLPGASAHPFFWAGLIGIGDMKSLK